MVTVKLGELREIIEGLNEVMSKELPIKPAYWLGKLAKKVQAEVHDFEESRLRLVQKYALRGEDGQPIVGADNKYRFADTDAFNAEFSELTETETTIDFSPIPINAFGDVKLSPIAMIGLDKFIEIGE